MGNLHERIDSVALIDGGAWGRGLGGGGQGEGGCYVKVMTMHEVLLFLVV